MPDSRTRMTRIMLATTLSAAVLLSAGCSSRPTAGLPAASAATASAVSVAVLKELRVNALPDAGRSTATALDILIVHDRTVLPQLPKTGQEWFARKQLLLANLKGSVKLVSVLAPPGIAMNVPLPPGAGVLQVLAYADAEKQPVADISSYRCALVLIAAGSISTSECR